ncbi:MAG: hypothetical protein Fur0028_07020 [Bacteroidales bacterium]
MLKLLITLAIAVALCSCNTKTVDNRKQLNSKTENSVQLGDTLVIFTGECKGCKFSTSYGFTDSLGIIKKSDYKRSDPCPECDGGSYDVEIEFVPLKTGRTVLKMYQHEWAMSDSIYVPEILDYEQKPIIVDSALVATFIIDVKNK